MHVSGRAAWDGVKFAIDDVGTHRQYFPQTTDLYELWTSRLEFRDISYATIVHGVQLLAGTLSFLTLFCYYRRYVYACNVTNQELIGKPDRLRRTEVVNKDRRCDATFAYQQIMVDVRREVLDYTSR